MREYLRGSRGGGGRFYGCVRSWEIWLSGGFVRNGGFQASQLRAVRCIQSYVDGSGERGINLFVLTMNLSVNTSR